MLLKVGNVAPFPIIEVVICEKERLAPCYLTLLYLTKWVYIKQQYWHGVGRIWTGDLQRPRLASYQARQQPQYRKQLSRPIIRYYVSFQNTINPTFTVARIFPWNAEFILFNVGYWFWNNFLKNNRSVYNIL